MQSLFYFILLFVNFKYINKKMNVFINIDNVIIIVEFKKKKVFCCLLYLIVLSFFMNING